jgi:hypothetical protein
MALKIDAAVRRVKQVDFRGDERKENLIKYEIYQILKEEKETIRHSIFIVRIISRR